jgi:hypothetical protein
LHSLAEAVWVRIFSLTVANAIARSAARPFTYAYTYPSQSARRSGEVERGEWKSGLPEWLRQKEGR